MSFNKELFKQYIIQNRSLREKEDALAKAFNDIERDNYVIGIVPTSYAIMVENMIRALFGEEAFEWAMWYLYDAPNSAKGKTITVNEKEIDVTDIDAFCDFIETYTKEQK